MQGKLYDALLLHIADCRANSEMEFMICYGSFQDALSLADET